MIAPLPPSIHTVLKLHLSCIAAIRPEVKAITPDAKNPMIGIAKQVINIAEINSTRLHHIPSPKPPSLEGLSKRVIREVPAVIIKIIATVCGNT